MEIMDISKIVKKIRTDNGWTQDELAKKLDKTQAVISRYESGEYTPPGDVLMRILRFEKITKQ